MIKICLRCQREALIYAKGLCASCYNYNLYIKRLKMGLVSEKQRKNRKEYFKKWYKKWYQKNKKKQ